MDPYETAYDDETVNISCHGSAHSNRGDGRSYAAEPCFIKEATRSETLAPLEIQ